MLGAQQRHHQVDEQAEPNDAADGVGQAHVLPSNTAQPATSASIRPTKAATAPRYQKSTSHLPSPRRPQQWHRAWSATWKNAAVFCCAGVKAA